MQNFKKITCTGINSKFTNFFTCQKLNFFTNTIKNKNFQLNKFVSSDLLHKNNKNFSTLVNLQSNNEDCFNLEFLNSENFKNKIELESPQNIFVIPQSQTNIEEEVSIDMKGRNSKPPKRVTYNF